MKILVHSAINDVLAAQACLVLGYGGYQPSVEEDIDVALAFEFGLIVLIADEIGVVDIIRYLRDRKCTTPILTIGSCHKIPSVCAHLNAGGDDYLPAPYHRDELNVRCQAIIRRSARIGGNVVTIGDMSVDLDTHVVRVGGVMVPLTSREYDMMELMVLRKGNVLSKEAFLTHLYGGRDEPELKIIDVFICKLRKKLGASAKHVATVWGRGYILTTGEGLEVVAA